MSSLLNPFLLVAALLAGWGLWHLVCWLASGARLPLRGRRGTASGFTAAGLSAEAFYRPSARYVIDMKVREQSQREDDEEGDPPESGMDSRVDGIFGGRDG